MDRRAPAAGGPAAILLAGALVGAAYLALPPGPPRWSLQVLATLAAAGAVVAGTRAHRPATTWPWLTMAAGLAVLGLAGLVGGVLEGGSGPVPVPAVAALDLLGGGAIACGVVGLVQVRAPRGRAGIIDAGIVAAAGTALLWAYAAAPALESVGAGPRRTVAVALLVGLHAASLAAGVRLLVARAWGLPSFWALLGSGLLVTAGSLPFVLVARQGLPPSWMPLSWLGAAALLAAAATHPSMRTLTEPLPVEAEGGPHIWRWVFLAGAALAVPLVGFVLRLGDRELLNELSAGAATVVVLLVVWRTYGIVAARDRAATTAAELADFNAAVLGSLMSLTAVLDDAGRVIDANDHWTSMATAGGRGRLWSPLGAAYPDDLAAAAADGVPDAAQAAAAVRDVLAGEREDAELELAAYLDGGRRWFIMRVSPLAGRQGVVVSHHDVTWRLESEQELRIRADQQATVSWLGQQALTDVDLPTLLDEAATMVAVTLSIGRVTVFERLETGALVVRAGIGWAESDVGVATVGGGSSSLAGYAIEADQPVVVDDLAGEDRFLPVGELVEQGYRRGIAVTIAGREGPWGVLTAHSGPDHEFTTDDAHFFQSVANVLSGAIERRRSEQEARHAALHDPLTGLPNRELLHDRLAQALSHSEGDVAVVYCDLDDFKAVNVALGHHAGDALLRAVAARLSAHLRPGDTVARVAGDEFVGLLTGVDGAAEAMRVAAAVRAALDAPFTVEATERRITASVGVAVATPDDDAESLVRSADAAMRRAKRRGRGLQTLFDEELRERTDHRRRLAEDLRGAVRRGELSVVYQPVVAVDDGHLLAAEALVRWQHPVRGAISPAVFIPIAEDNGAIDEIGAWVLERTCRQVAEWSDLLPDDRPFTVYVNLSARQLAQGDFVRRVAETLATTSTAPSRLGLEITESLLLDDAESATRTLDGLKSLGVTLAMDDFGTGYSSLSYLKRLPVDVVKVDRSFVGGLGHDAGDSAIVAAVVRMAAALELRVTAEGVETEAQLRELRALGCDQAQGYLFARPLPADELRALL